MVESPCVASDPITNVNCPLTDVNEGISDISKY